MKKNNVVNQNIDDTLRHNFMPYAMSVIVSRAIPEIDGFKPSHRKLLYTMYAMGLLRNARTKSANVVGQTMKLNPHGDQAIYETMVRLTRGHDALIHPYIDSKGNFGKVSSRDMKYAAARYTEVKLAKICAEIFKNIDKDTVDFVDNYDSQMKEPTLLPTTFPNVLVNANKGIAVGMASSIASFNLTEICDYTIARLRGEDPDPLSIVLSPDFSTGGYLLYDKEALETIYQTGQGSIKLRAKYHYDKKNKLIEITEIPYTTTVEAIIDKIVDAVKAGKIKEISDVRDETDLKGLKIALELKRGTDPDVLMQKLFNSTPLEDNFSCNFNILIEGRPMVLGIKQIIDHWIAFRLGCLRRQLNYELTGLNQKLHLLLGLHKVLLDIDKAIKIIRKTTEDHMVVPNLMTAYAIDEVQAEFVAEIKLRNLNKKYLINKIAEIERLKEQISESEMVLGSEAKQKTRIIEQLREIIKKYGKARCTEIIQLDEAPLLAEEDLVEDFNLKLFLTAHGYIKKISLASLRAYSDQKLKDDDEIIQEIASSNLADINFFTNQHNVYKVKAYELADHKASELGSYLENVLELATGEDIIFMHPTTAYNGWLIFAFANGKMAKIPLSSYQTKTNRKKLVNAYSDRARLVSITYIEDDQELIFVRSDQTGEKTVIVFNSALLSEKVTRSSQGVTALRLKKGSAATYASTLDKVTLAKPSRYYTDKIPLAGSKIATKDHLLNPQF